MVEEVKADKVYAFDNQGDFEDLFRTYIRTHQNWKYYKEKKSLPMLTKSAEEAKVEAALQFAEYCMLHTCVIPHIQRSDVIVLSELKQHVNALRTCLEKL